MQSEKLLTGILNFPLRKIPYFPLISWCAEILWKGTANRPKLCGSCAFPQNFHTRKLDENTVFFAVFLRHGFMFNITETKQLTQQ